jgi:hypothetical protein
MILNHIWGLYKHPKKEGRDIKKRHESLIYSLVHTFIVALIPAICCYYATAHIGWTIGSGDPIKLSNQSAQIMAVSMYFALAFGVFTLGFLIKWMAKTFDSKPDYIQSLELATYTATPLIMVGVTALFPVLWFVILSVISAMIYSIYLLYSGVPIMMNIPKEKSFIYASSVVTCGLVILISLIAITAMMWTTGFGPEFVN